MTSILQALLLHSQNAGGRPNSERRAATLLLHDQLGSLSSRLHSLGVSSLEVSEPRAEMLSLEGHNYCHIELSVGMATCPFSAPPSTQPTSKKEGS